MSDNTYQITVRDPSKAVMIWTYTFAGGFYSAVGASMHAAFGNPSTTVALIVGAVELALGIGCLATYAYYRRHRDEAAGDVRFSWGVNRLWWPGLISFYGAALLPLALWLGTLGGIWLGKGIAEATYSATATISTGQDSGSTVASWHVDEGRSDTWQDDEAISNGSFDHDAATLGQAVTLTGPWDGIDTLTIESIETKTFPATMYSSFGAEPINYEARCLIIAGTLTTTDGKARDLSFSFADAPEPPPDEGSIGFLTRYPMRYLDPPAGRESSSDASACRANVWISKGYQDMTLGLEADARDGRFIVKFWAPRFAAYDKWPPYVGVKTADGTSLYWELGE